MICNLGVNLPIFRGYTRIARELDSTMYAHKVSGLLNTSKSLIKDSAFAYLTAIEASRNGSIRTGGKS